MISMSTDQWKICLIVLFLVCRSYATARKEDKVSQEYGSTRTDSVETFKPTHEWQIVKPGQPIPKGLHVRVNFETGQTEAKLMSDSTNERTDVLSIYKDEVGKDDDPELNEKISAIKESLLKLEKNDNHASDIVNAVREQFRSYKDLKEAFRQLNMTVKTDLEIMHDLFVKFKIMGNHSEKSKDEMILILTDLEYLVHQYDNALEFVKLDGVSEIVLPMLNSSQPVLRAEAANLLGSAAQSNVKVQIAALESGAISFLLRAISLDSDPIVRIRSLYALSCLIRNFPIAQARFVQEGGLSILAKLFEKGQENHRLQIKVITLLHDLLLERQNTINLISDPASVNTEELNIKVKQYKVVGLEEKLVEYDWCSRIANIIVSQDQNWSRTKKRDDLTSAVADLSVRPEHDFIEKVSDTLLAMVNICHHSFNVNSDFKRMISELREWYLELAAKENLNKSLQHAGDSEESYLYFSGIADVLEHFSQELERLRAKDEL